MDVIPPTRSDDGASGGTLVPDKDFWLADGNVVLICESVGYRVHQSILSRHSNVFKDMFAVGTAEGEETFEGCVTLRLHDSPEDFSFLLKALYDLRYPPYGTKVSLSRLRRLLLLANKYLLEELRNQIIEHLRILFPSKRSDLTSLPRALANPDDFSPLLGIQIGQESNVPAIIPSAFLFAATYGVSEILGNNTGDDQDVSFQARQACLKFKETLLETADKEICEPLIWKNNTLLYCDKIEPCQGFPPQALHDFGAIYTRNTNGIFYIKFRELIQQKYAEKDDLVCERCWAKADAVEENIRDRIWEAVPVSCGFNDWAAVEEAQTRTNEDITSES
ncbi:hypothetical protein DENSPDRAFT_870024 [Dentipellis sp. KUC8613]|nr:hypothetical protein DENSPDRAFT_870024 [Dentipellis sp. KUC8613]